MMGETHAEAARRKGGEGVGRQMFGGGGNTDAGDGG
jgi:hypothetical protein